MLSTSIAFAIRGTNITSVDTRCFLTLSISGDGITEFALNTAKRTIIQFFAIDTFANRCTDSLSTTKIAYFFILNILRTSEAFKTCTLTAVGEVILIDALLIQESFLCIDKEDQ